MLTIEHIRVATPSGDGLPLLDDVSFSVSSGDELYVVGANGAGKTTLLNTMCGVTPLQRGSLSWSDPTASSRVAMLFQEPDNQFVASRVYDELLLSLPEDDSDTQPLDEAVQRFELRELLERRPHSLSGGEQQRLALAMTWLQKPALVLLDEPTSYLDSEQQKRCMALLRALRAEGSAVVVASPTRDGLQPTDRVVWLERGRCTHFGSLSEVPQAVAHSATPTRQRSPEPSGALRIRMQDVGVSFGDARVIDGLSFQIAERECVGITGSNGSGKTTLLKIIAGLQEPSSGFAKIDFPRERIFFVPQNPEKLFFAETVFDEVAFGLRRGGCKGEQLRERVHEALRDVELPASRFSERSPFSLSIGEMRRLSLAVALALLPALLLLDEPTAGLDREGANVLETAIDAFRAAGCTTILSSHDRRFVARISDRSILLG